MEWKMNGRAGEFKTNCICELHKDGEIAGEVSSFPPQGKYLTTTLYARAKIAKGMFIARHVDDVKADDVKKEVDKLKWWVEKVVKLPLDKFPLEIFEVLFHSAIRK